MPFERPAVAVALVAASTSAGLVRRSSLPVIPREAVAMIASLVPALVALRGEELTSYHGAEHVSIGTYETGERGDQGARSLRLAPRRPAARGERGRRRGGRARAEASPDGRAVRRRGRCRRSRGRGLRLDGTQRRSAALARARTSRHGAPAAGVDERAERRAARGRERGARGVSGSGAGLAVSVAPSRAAGERLDPAIFDLPVEKMRDGYYSDAYFNHARSALLHDGKRPRVVSQVFQRKHSMLGGMDEAIAILKLCSAEWESLTVHALARRRPRRAVGDRDDRRGRLHRLRPSGDGRPRERWRGGR